MASYRSADSQSQALSNESVSPTVASTQPDTSADTSTPTKKLTDRELRKEVAGSLSKVREFANDLAINGRHQDVKDQAKKVQERLDAIDRAAKRPGGFRFSHHLDALNKEVKALGKVDAACARIEQQLLDVTENTLGLGDTLFGFIGGDSQRLGQSNADRSSSLA